MQCSAMEGQGGGKVPTVGYPASQQAEALSVCQKSV